MKRNALLTLIVAMSLLASPLFAAPSPKSAVSVPIAGNFTSAAGVGSFTGTFTIHEFAAQGNQLVANGILSGTLVDATGLAVGSVIRPVTMPVSVRSGDAVSAKQATANATCPILHLDLGPLSLDLLGLQVDLAQVVLDIVAESGTGNLLGNLLCAVTNLLNGAGSLVDLANLLNQILQILQGLLG